MKKTILNAMLCLRKKKKIIAENKKLNLSENLFLKTQFDGYDITYFKQSTKYNFKKTKN
jgi:hypothetical protein